MYTLQVRVHRIHKINNIAMHKVLTHELYFCSTDCRNAVERLYSSELWWAWWAAHMKFTSEGRNQSTGSHYNDVIMGPIAFQITSLTIVYSIVYSDADQRKHQSSASLAFVRGINRGPVNSPHKWPVTRKIFPFDDVIMKISSIDWPLGNVAVVYVCNFQNF